MSGVMPVSTTLRMSMPTGAPRSSRVGIRKCACSPRQISAISSVTAMASCMPPAPTKPATAGEAAMAKPPRPTVSTMALSPRSGLASSGPKPGKYSPWGTLTGAVNQRSPSPATRMPKSVPWRAMVATIVDPSMPRQGSAETLAAAMARFRKNWSLVARQSATRARAPVSEVVGAEPQHAAQPLVDGGEGAVAVPPVLDDEDGHGGRHHARHWPRRAPVVAGRETHLAAGELLDRGDIALGPALVADRAEDGGLHGGARALPRKRRARVKDHPPRESQGVSGGHAVDEDGLAPDQPLERCLVRRLDVHPHDSLSPLAHIIPL